MLLEATKLLALAAALLAAAALVPADASAQQQLEAEVAPLLEQLDAPTAAERSAAEARLNELATADATSAAEALRLLPEPDATMPAGVRGALVRVRLRAQRAIARLATGPSRVTLHADQKPVAEVLAEIERQTGARFRDNRQAFGGEADPRPISVSLDEEPFWSAVDTVLDAADLSVYPYGEADALTLVDRASGAAPRVGAAEYAGPFRIEPLTVSAFRGLRDADTSRLDVQIEVAWEPRLRPIALSIPMDEVQAAVPSGALLAPRTPDQSLDLEATPGEQAMQVTLSFERPPRETDRIASTRGRMVAMIPATPHTFRVAKVGQARTPLTQRFGDATVVLERFEKPGAVWELHMRVRLEGAGDSLASHRGWVFQNASYLIDANGKRYEHAGFETTMQTSSEIGLAYLFDLSGAAVVGFGFDEPDANADPEGEADAEADEPVDPKELTWVYETATGVHTVPITWELVPIDLP
ncbi:hypothetical protein [Botrimarina sp.]|uniref:hypothetical protein n=1 Tax=Botrimarina sp. TaxID=2795802 RepID=UPI0032EB7B3B